MHLYKIGSLTATELVDQTSDLFCLFLLHYVVSQGAPDSKVVRSRESVRIPGVSPYSGTVCWLASRQTTTIPNREGKHTGMQVAALLPADVGPGHGGSRIEGSLWRNLREDR